MKAILVIDAPIDCDECPLNSNGYCDVLQEYAFLNEWVEDAPYYSLMGKGDCPLKPIPTKEEIYERIYQAYGYGNDETYQRIRQEVEDIYDEMIGEQE